MTRGKDIRPGSPTIPRAALLAAIGLVVILYTAVPHCRAACLTDRGRLSVFSRLLGTSDLVLVARRDVQGRSWSVWLDCLVGPFGAASVLAVLLSPGLASTVTGSLSQATAESVAYPLDQAATWHAQGRPLTVAVNLSAGLLGYLRDLPIDELKLDRPFISP